VHANVAEITRDPSWFATIIAVSDLQPRPDEDLDRHARVREFAVVAAVHDPRAAAGQQVGGASDLPGTGNRTLRAVASDGALFSYDNVTVSVTR